MPPVNKEVDEDFDLEGAVDDIADSLGFAKVGDEVAEDKGFVEDGDADPTDAKAEETPAVVEAPSEETPTETGPAAPKSWKKEVLPEWEKVPASVKAEILRREEDFHAGIESYKENSGFGKTVREAINPYLPIMQQYGIDPVENIKSLMGAHYQLATGNNQQKLALFQKLAQDYRVDLSELGTMQPLAQVDPRLEQINQQVAQTNARLASFEQERAATQRNAVMSEVQKFAEDPANPFFEDVANDIAILIKSGVASNLREAYDKAVWTNPVTRQKEIDRLNATKKQAVAAKTQIAKKATSINVKSAPKSQSATAPKGSIEETMQATLDRIYDGDA